MYLPRTRESHQSETTSTNLVYHDCLRMYMLQTHKKA